MIWQTSAVACLLTACFAGGGDRDGYDVDNYWNELGVTHCEVMRACCTPAEYNDWWTSSTGDTIDCVTAHQAPLYATQIRDAIERQTIEFDEGLAHACIAALQAQPCADFEQAYRYRETYCASPLIGKLRDGERCQVDEECEGELCQVGICHARLPEGATCFVGVNECQKPLACSDPANGNNFTCNAGKPPGASCFSDDECLDGWCKEDPVANGSSCLDACNGL